MDNLRLTTQINSINPTNKILNIRARNYKEEKKFSKDNSNKKGKKNTKEKQIKLGKSNLDKIPLKKQLKWPEGKIKKTAINTKIIDIKV